jgi:hypothetical protein
LMSDASAPDPKGLSQQMRLRVALGSGLSGSNRDRVMQGAVGGTGVYPGVDTGVGTGLCT